MTVRSTMVDLLATLRGLTNAGTADYQIGGQDYWSDNQLQAILDRNRTDVLHVTMFSEKNVATDGTNEWKRYSTDYDWLESTDGGTAIFSLQYAGGSVVPLSAYTPDYERGVVEFDQDTTGVTVYMNARSFDVFAAAADVWEQKAAQAASMVDFSTLNHSVKRSHVQSAYMAQAKRFRGMSRSGTGSGQMIRSDLA